MKISVETKFNIGDVVRSIGAEPGAFVEPFAILSSGNNRTETRYIVLSIHAVAGSGGTQVAYTVRGVAADGGLCRKLMRLTEQELVMSTPFLQRGKSE